MTRPSRKRIRFPELMARGDLPGSVIAAARIRLPSPLFSHAARNEPLILGRSDTKRQRLAMTVSCTAPYAASKWGSTGRTSRSSPEYLAIFAARSGDFCERRYSAFSTKLMRPTRSLTPCPPSQCVGQRELCRNAPRSQAVAAEAAQRHEADRVSLA